MKCFSTVDSHATAVLQFNGTPVNPISINIGSNNISLLVTVQDGSTKTYTVTVTRVGGGSSDGSTGDSNRMD
jgi:hypothetical protein